MEEIHTTPHLYRLDIDEDGKKQLTAISRWMLINAITAFSSLAVTLLTTFYTYFKFINMGLGSFINSKSALQLFITTAVSLVLNILLLQAATHIKKSLAATDQAHLHTGLRKMASYFSVVGILIIAGLSLMILALFAVLG